MPGGVGSPFAWRGVLVLCLARLGVYLLSSGPLAYGFMSDEFYYLDCTRHLAWGYVDHQPLAIAILKMIRPLIGDSLLALHVVPALAHCLAIVLVTLLARELGGGPAAQLLAGLTTLIAPVYLAVTDFYSANAFEPAFWAAAALLMARLVNGGDRRLWLLLGVTLGLGLLNRISTLWFGAGLAIGLLVTPQRRWLVTPWPWLAAGVAAALFAPHVVWQIRQGWPTLEFMRNAMSDKMVAKSPLAFAAGQLLVMHPAVAPVWVAGLLFFFGSTDGRRHQVLAWTWVSVLGILMASGSVRANYAAPAYAPLLAAGGVTWERSARLASRAWLQATLCGTLAVAGLVVAPMATPLVPPRWFAAYQRVLGVSAPVDQTEDLGVLPLHFALRFGWPELIDAVSEAYATLSPDERREAVILGRSFGDTGALNVLGARRGLPPAISGHNNYWLWGPGDASGRVVIALSEDGRDLRRWYQEVDRVGDVSCEYCLPLLSRLHVYVCRAPFRPLRAWWQEVKRYV